MYIWKSITRFCRNNESNNKISFTREQFHVQLACARTIHRSQWLTMDKLDFEPKGVRQHGIIYVSLSHVKYIKSLYLLNKLEHRKISLNYKVVVELDRLRENASY